MAFKDPPHQPVVELALLYRLRDQTVDLLQVRDRGELHEQPWQCGITERTVGLDLIRLGRELGAVDDHPVARAPGRGRGDVNFA
jgi:hypothetical protein